jgi:hypothetical protein
MRSAAIPRAKSVVVTATAIVPEDGPSSPSRLDVREAARSLTSVAVNRHRFYDLLDFKATPISVVGEMLEAAAEGALATLKRLG